MLFNSIEFLLFLPVVVLVYFLLPHKFRWLFLLLASYFFYMCWIPTYAVLILFSTITTYASGILLDRQSERQGKNQRKFILVVNLVINLGILFLYKYYNFINESFIAVFQQFDVEVSTPSFNYLLPVGISFYTFQAIGYTIDVYKGQLKAEKHFGKYALFVSFFPQLVAGPIERASHLLPQFSQEHRFEFQRFIDGVSQILWGLFMKVVVADRLAIYVNAVYGNVDKHNGSTLIFATVLFAFQIYGDFAGYSNMAIGVARILGFDLMENFRRPYFARNIKDFWSRWHISLSTWFRDYVYIPLGGNRKGVTRHIINLFITFLVSGIWHGANWTFFIWGALHGSYLVIMFMYSKMALSKRFSFSGLPNGIIETFRIVWTFIIVVVAWVFFRADTITDALEIIQKMAFTHGALFLNKTVLIYGFIGLMVMFTKEFIDEFDLNIKLLSSSNLYLRATGQIVILYLIVLLGVVDSSQFIYFQF